MRKIITTTFVTMDGVMQAPGGPEEDISGGFLYGGWMVHHMDEMVGGIIEGFMALDFDLLLGKRTYDIFAAYWPHATTDVLVATQFNNARKYVVTHSESALSWNNSHSISGDVVTQLKNLKGNPGPDLWVHGSGDLIQLLLAENLIDIMHVWTIPVTIGSGKRLFSYGTLPQEFKLTDSNISPSGVIIATYEPAGDLVTGIVGE